VQSADGAALLGGRGWVGYRSPPRAKKLNGLADWLAERFRRHRGNADVVRQNLEREHGIKASRRTVERAVSHWRQELRAEARATMRFETPPGYQLQIDFGEIRTSVASESVRRVRGGDTCPGGTGRGSPTGGMGHGSPTGRPNSSRKQSAQPDARCARTRAASAKSRVAAA